MKITATAITLGIATSLLLPVTAARAAGEAAIFDQLYGQQLRQVAATPATADDAELAAKLLSAARSVNDSPALQLLMYEKALELSVGSPDSIPAALEAYDRLGELKPEARPSHRDRLLQGLRVQHARAKGDQKLALGHAYLEALLAAADELAAQNPPDTNEAARLARMALPVAAEVDRDQVEPIRRKIDALVAMTAVRNQVRQLNDRLLASPDDKAAAKRLTELHLIELDDPAYAAKIAPATADVELIRLTGLAAGGPGSAAGGPGSAAANDSLAVGDWYADLARRAPATARPAMLQRAAGWYERFLDLHGAEDAQRLKARLALNQVNDQLTATGIGPAAAPGTTTTPAASEVSGAGAPRIVGSLLKDVKVEQSVTLDNTTRPYVIEGTLTLHKPGTGDVKVEIGPGVEVRGGRIDIEGNTKFIVKGTADRPVIFRNVTFRQTIYGWFQAEHAILDNCKFQKYGAYYLLAGYTAKWSFDKSLLYQCAFPHFNKTDWGFSFVDSSLVDMKFAGTSGDLGHKWNTIRNCNFIGCVVQPTLGWTSRDSNFYLCQFDATTKAFPRKEPLTINAYFSGTRGDHPQAVWSAVPDGEKVRVQPALEPFPVSKFDCVPPISALRNDRTARSLLFLK